MTRPATVARWCGLDGLTDDLHGGWMRQMICGRRDMTLLAHRGSYKTTCLAFAMAAMCLLYPARNMIFLMKSIQLGKEAFGLPEREPGQWTNFIR